MPERFLILGASSFYGRSFADYVRGRGDEAICLSRPEWYMGDDLPDEPAKYIVNFASRSLVAESWDDPQGWMMTNAILLTSLLQAVMRRAHAAKFVHVSTPEVYGHTDGWVDENYTNWQPTTPYAVSRAAGDMMLAAFHRAYSLPMVITRTANIYGPGQTANRFIPLAFDTFSRGEKLLLHGQGHTRRSWIHVKDACAATYLIAKRGSVGQTYHISTTRDTSVSDLAHKICRMLGKRPEELIGTQPDRLGKDHAYLLMSDRIRRMGWRDNYTLEKGLQEYVAWAGARPTS